MIITLIAAISADGKIAERDYQSSLDWTSKEDTRFFVEKTKEIGTMVMGRKTFETIGKGLPGRRMIVMSSKVGATEGVEWANESVPDLVKRLTAEGVSGIAVCGGSTVYYQFLQSGLVDELYLTVEPVLFGGGVSLASGFGRIDLELVEAKPLGGRSVLLHYRIPKV